MSGSSPAFRESVARVCATLPGAVVSDPWGGGHEAWKVGGKMFACIGAVQTGVSVKTDGVDTAQMLIETGQGARAPYFHRSWVHLPENCPPDDLDHRLRQAYAAIRATLPKKAQAALG